MRLLVEQVNLNIPGLDGITSNNTRSRILAYLCTREDEIINLKDLKQQVVVVNYLPHLQSLERAGLLVREQNVPERPGRNQTHQTVWIVAQSRWWEILRIMLKEVQ